MLVITSDLSWSPMWPFWLQTLVTLYMTNNRSWYLACCPESTFRWRRTSCPRLLSLSLIIPQRQPQPAPHPHSLIYLVLFLKDYLVWQSECSAFLPANLPVCYFWVGWKSISECFRISQANEYTSKKKKGPILICCLDRNVSANTSPDISQSCLFCLRYAESGISAREEKSVIGPCDIIF